MIVPSMLFDEFDFFPVFPLEYMLSDKKGDDAERKLFGHRGKNLMSTDIKEKGDNYEMQVDLPGFKKEDVSVVLKDGYLTVSAAKECENEESECGENGKEVKYLFRERCAGSCSRNYYIGEQYEKDDVKANFKHGILTIALPKKEKNELCKKDCIEIGD